MSKFNKLFALLIVVVIIVVGSFVADFVYLVNRPLLSANLPVTTFVFRPNTPFKVLAQQLKTAGLLKYPRYFVWLAYLRGATKEVQAGEYTIGFDTTPVILLHNMILGRVTLRPFTIIPGSTFKQLIANLETTPKLLHTLQGLTTDQIMAKLGHFGEIPEGRFFPDTYMFTLGSKDVEILKTAYNLMQRQLTLAWQNRESNVRVACPYKTLIIASVIEKEASIPQERRIIAGVVAKRLARNMYLQLDPTLRYGLNKKPDQGLTSRDLKSTNSYNTYRHKGLPPTPICMPSLDSIEATLHPRYTSYLYFVAKGDGSHHFSATLKQHITAINKYQK